jgi:5-methylcytosine-specific restriction endonuclease McrA
MRTCGAGARKILLSHRRLPGGDWLKIKGDHRKYVRHLAIQRQWAADHPEAIRRRAARYRKKNREKIRAYARRWMRAWYRANLREARKRLKDYRLRSPEKWRAYDREVYHRNLKTDAVWMRNKLAKGRAWARRNPEKQRERVGRYRVRKLSASGSHTFAEWLTIIRLHRWKGFYCGQRVTRSTVTKDHLIPLFKKGTDFPTNLVPACKSCNSGKAARLAYKDWKGG